MTGTGYKAITRTSSSAVTLYNETTQISRTATSAAINSAIQALGRANGINGQGIEIGILNKMPV